MWEIAKKLKISYNGVYFREQHKQALTRIEREVGGPGAQLSKGTSTLESLVWEIDAAQVLNWQLH